METADDLTKLLAGLQTFSSCLLVILTFCYVRTTSRQLRAMRDALKATGDSNWLAKKSLDLASKALTETHEHNNAALEATRTSNEATKESNRIAELSHRSWLIIETLIDPSGLPNPTTNVLGEPFLSASVSVRNAGGVPATVNRCGWIIFSQGPPDQIELSYENSTPSAAIIFGEKPTSLDFGRRLNNGEYAAIGMLGQIQMMPIVSASMHVPPEIQNAATFFYLCWVIEYSDCLDKAWRTVRGWRFNTFVGKWEEATESQCKELR